jgi:hypothetical protein
MSFCFWCKCCCCLRLQNTVELECVFRELIAWRERLALKNNMAASAILRDDLVYFMTVTIVNHVAQHHSAVEPDGAATSSTTSASTLVQYQSSSAAPTTSPSSPSVVAVASGPRLRHPDHMMDHLKRLQGMRAQFLSQNATGLVAAVQRGLDVATSFRRSANALALSTLPAPFCAPNSPQPTESYRPALYAFWDGLSTPPSGSSTSAATAGMCSLNRIFRAYSTKCAIVRVPSRYFAC